MTLRADDGATQQPLDPRAAEKAGLQAVRKHALGAPASCTAYKPLSAKLACITHIVQQVSPQDFGASKGTKVQ